MQLQPSAARQCNGGIDGNISVGRKGNRSTAIVGNRRVGNNVSIGIECQRISRVPSYRIINCNISATT